MASACYMKSDVFKTCPIFIMFFCDVWGSEHSSRQPSNTKLDHETCYGVCQVTPQVSSEVEVQGWRIDHGKANTEPAPWKRKHIDPNNHFFWGFSGKIMGCCIGGERFIEIWGFHWYWGLAIPNCGGFKLCWKFFRKAGSSWGTSKTTSGKMFPYWTRRKKIRFFFVFLKNGSSSNSKHHF